MRTQPINGLAIGHIEPHTHNLTRRTTLKSIHCSRNSILNENTIHFQIDAFQFKIKKRGSFLLSLLSYFSNFLTVPIKKEEKSNQENCSFYVERPTRVSKFLFFLISIKEATHIWWFKKWLYKKTSIGYIAEG